MLNLTVRCGCGRQMATDGRQGRGAYRCGCGARVHVDVQPVIGRLCVFTEAGVACRLAAVVGEPVPLCDGHDKAQKASFIGYLADIPLTSDEANRLIAAWLDVAGLGHVTGKTYLQERAEADAAKERHAAARGRKNEVVYYIRFRDRIKIGTTRNLRQRLYELPYDELLAIEPGGREVERERHEQFAASRVIGEWFEPDTALLKHIASLPAPR
jgi:Meiotically up-regulated gene 113